jgi:transcriptional regulator with XRE-family HTH domain
MSTALQRSQQLERQPPAARPDVDAVRRSELAAFLRSRRERISPVGAGFPAVGRRRTPGLRREEVAQLAGVGVTWYTWLEQGRDIKVSDSVLNSVARTLQLDPHERAHLYTLAGATAPLVDDEIDEIPAGIRATLRQVEPFPAVVQNARYDMLAYNRTYGRLAVDLDALHPSERNCMWQLFSNPEWRKAFPDREHGARRMVAQFRAGMAEHVAEPAWKASLRRLRTCPHFVALWDQHEVDTTPMRSKRVRNPIVGILDFDVVNTWLQPRAGVRLLVFAPSDAETGRRLDRLQAYLEEDRCG